MWVVLMCNANFDVNGDMNHWVPAWTEAELGDEYFKSAVSLADKEGEKVAKELEDDYAQKAVAYECAKAHPGGKNSESAQIALAELEAAAEEIHHEQNWQEFRERCRLALLHPIRVPADGNCLLWSLKALKREDVNGGGGFRPADFAPDRDEMWDIAKARCALSRAWRQARDEVCWQDLYECFYVDEVEPPVEPPAGNTAAEPQAPDNKPVKAELKVKQEAPTMSTPPRRLGAGSIPPIDLSTPEGKSEAPPKLKKAVGKCRPAPGWKSQKEISETLEGPPKQSASQNCVPDNIPDVPDIEKRSKEEPADEEPGDKEDQPSKRRRVGRKKEKSQREREMTALNQYLASIGIIYMDTWQPAHWRPGSAMKELLVWW